MYKKMQQYLIYLLVGISIFIIGYKSNKPKTEYKEIEKIVYKENVELIKGEDRIIYRTIKANGDINEVIRESIDTKETKNIEKKIQKEITQKNDIPTKYKVTILTDYKNLLPDANYLNTTIGVSTRLSNSFWLSTQYNIKNKDITIGVEYEW